MNSVTVTMGAATIAFGLFTLIARVMRPQMFKKLQPMKERWGPRVGVAIHFVGYTLLPIVYGVVTLLSGFAGGSPF